MNRDEILKNMLAPITWNMSSSIEARKNLVINRRKVVRDAYPFMNENEKKLADKWFEEESHSGLWD